MRNAPTVRQGHFLLAAVIALFSAGCADDATRIERAREHQQNAEYRAAIIELKNVLQADAQNLEARTMLGEVTLQNGDSVTAIKEMRRARELGASADQYATTLARALLRQGDYQEVVNLDPETVSHTGKKAELLALIGAAEFQRGDQAAAQRRFQSALALMPDQPDALLGNSKLAAAGGDLGAAESGLKRALQLNPDDPESLAALAGVQQISGRHAEAQANYEKALKIIETTSRAQEQMLYKSGLIETLISQKKTAQAQALGSEMIKSTKEHPLALLKAGRADFASRDYDGTIDTMQRIITAHPSAEPARMLLAGAAIAKGDKELAATHLQAVVEQNPRNENARKLLARARMDMGDSDEALQLLEPLLAGGTDDTRLLAMAGAANLRSGNQEAGIALLEHGMEIGSTDPEFATKAAADFLAAGEINRAIEVLESLPESELVGHRELLLVLALLQKGDHDAARAKAQSIINDRPESFEAHRLMGGFHLAVGELDQARSEFEKTLELNPGDFAAVINLAKIDVAQQKPQQAEARFQAVLDANPGNLLSLTALAELAERRGDTKAKIELLEQARVANPGAAMPLLTLGHHYLGEGRLGLAGERANQAIRVEPGNGETHLLSGLVLMQDGRPTEAIISFERAIAATPRLAAAHFHLGRAQAATGNADASVASFKRAADIDKAFFPARVALAGAAVERGDLNAAMTIAESLVSDFPDRGEPLVLRANVLTARQDLPGALASFRKAAAILPSREIAGQIYRLQKRMGASEPWSELRQWVADHPDDTAARALLAAAYSDNGIDDLAIENFTQVMVVKPDVQVAMTLARIELAAGNAGAAADWLRQAVALEPAGFKARAALAGLELQGGNAKAAKKMLAELRKDHPNARELDVLEGDTSMATGDFNDSIKAYDRALDTQPSELTVLKRYQAGQGAGHEDAWKVLESWYSNHPGHINVGLTLAQDYVNRDWNDEAVGVYRQVLKTDPTNLIALNNVAFAYLNRGGDGDLTEALAASSKAYKQAPENPAIADTYGWILHKDGQNDRALKLLAVAAGSADADAETVYHHSVVLEALGRDSEAVAILDRLLASNKTFASHEEAEVLRRRLSP